MEVHNIRGYLYEIFIAKHLKDNGFDECIKNKTTKGCEVNGKGEIEGRGEYHQIDFSGVYTKLTPYIYPLRVLAECKYYKKPLDKKIIRQYVGVMKDISENYYVPASIKKSNKKSIFNKHVPRFTDIPIIFSVNGFDTHSENLAWAQGVNLVSHKGLPPIQNTIEMIDSLAQHIKNACEGFSRCKESDCISLVSYAINEVDLTNINNEIEFEAKLHSMLLGVANLQDLHRIYHYCSFDGFYPIIYNLMTQLKDINTFIIATTEKGTVVNLVGNASFPKDLFKIDQTQLGNPEYNPNLAQAGVYFENLDNENNDRVFYFQFNDDERNGKFYFQPNRQMLSDQFSELSEKKRIDLKKQFVGKLTFIYEIDKVNRILEIEVKFPYETREELNKVLPNYERKENSE